MSEKDFVIFSEFVVLSERRVCIVFWKADKFGKKVDSKILEFSVDRQMAGDHDAPAQERFETDETLARFWKKIIEASDKKAEKITREHHEQEKLKKMLVTKKYSG